MGGWSISVAIATTLQVSGEDSRRMDNSLAWARILRTTPILHLSEKAKSLPQARWLQFWTAEEDRACRMRPARLLQALVFMGQLRRGAIRRIYSLQTLVLLLDLFSRIRRSTE